MKEPDYDKLLQQAHSCKAAQPLVADLANAIKVLRLLYNSALEANRLLIERDRLREGPDTWRNGDEQLAGD